VTAASPRVYSNLSMNERNIGLASLEEKENQLAGFFNEYYGRLAGYAFARTGNRRVSEDIASEVFLRALKALPSYSDRGLPMGAWLFRIAHNLVVDHYRSKNRQPEIALEEDIGEDGVCPTARLEQEHEMEQVSEAIKRLSPAQQEVVRLRFIAGLSSKETAALMGKSDGAVREMQREALSRLKVMLVENNDETH
jgi:RNA polymerase sigma-70 factor (ECF subfamily)